MLVHEMIVQTLSAIINCFNKLLQKIIQKIIATQKKLGDNLRMLVPYHRNKDASLKSTEQVFQGTTNLFTKQLVFSL